MGMLPNIGGPDLSTQVLINSFPVEIDEVMHGVGLRLSSHHVDESGESAIFGTCKKAAVLARQQMEVLI